MKISCNVCKDLYLLYENGEASEESAKLVESHIADCEKCKELLNNENDIPMKEILSESEKAEAKAVKDGLGKVKKRWKLSLVAVLMMIPLLGIGILLFHQCTGEGVAFTNIDDIQSVKKFMNLLQNEKYEEAASMLDYTGDYGSVVDTIKMGNTKLESMYGSSLTLEEYTAKRKEKLLAYLTNFKEAGYSVSDIRFNRVYSTEAGEWSIQIAFVEKGPEEFEQNVIAEFSCVDGKLAYCAAMEEKRLSAFEYAMSFNNMWNLDKTPTYEEYLEMEEAQSEMFE